MPTQDRSAPSCFLILPYSREFRRVKEAIKTAARRAGFRPVVLDEEFGVGMPIRELVAVELARADAVAGDLTGRNPNVFFELGQAITMGKLPLLLMQKPGNVDVAHAVPVDLQGIQCLFYTPTRSGLLELSSRLATALEEYRRSPPAARRPWVRVPTPFSIDWSRLDRSDAENLCSELLAQMGFRSVDWCKESREFDLIAELPKKDPDGFEYRELWLIAMGRHMPLEMLIEMMAYEPEVFPLRLLKRGDRIERMISGGRGDIPVITFLAILLDEIPSRDLERLHMRRDRLVEHRYPFNIRIRIWDRNYLTSLVQQFPQVGYKYFSDEGRSQSKYRKTPEELYQENVDLTTRQAALIADLESEKNRRVRAERDAVWKDIAFAAAHKMGNPIFAIETNLGPLMKRIEESRTREAAEVVAHIGASVEKAKDIVDQFKSLTRAQQITLVSTLLRPILEDACKTAQDQGVDCGIDCSSDIRVQGDPARLAECLDELASNSTHWFDKEERRILVKVSEPEPTMLPKSVDSTHSYAMIQFSDNGCGVPVENKDRIFDAFFSTRDQGTGLGLALVRRIVEGHGGAISESGVPGKGATFEVYLPLADAKHGSGPLREDTAG